MKLSNLIRLARPEHWIKNLIVFLPVVSSLSVADLSAWLKAAQAALAFCFVASASYISNDILDREKDRLHPQKKNRPIASGSVSPATAVTELVIFLVVGLALTSMLGPLSLAVVALYVLIQSAYSMWLKGVMILDVMCIAMGFVLRAAAGAVAINVAVSPYLFICTFTICLFMGFGKRRSESAAFGDVELAARHRRTLPGYTPQLLTHLTTLSAGVAIVSYIMYTISPLTVERFHTMYLVYTLPLVIYAVCRFEMLSALGRFTDPTDLILRDRPFQITLLVWMLSVGLILWQGENMQNWIHQFYR